MSSNCTLDESALREILAAGEQSEDRVRRWRNAQVAGPPSAALLVELARALCSPLRARGCVAGDAVAASIAEDAWSKRPPAGLEGGEPHGTQSAAPYPAEGSDAGGSQPLGTAPHSGDGSVRELIPDEAFGAVLAVAGDPEDPVSPSRATRRMLELSRRWASIAAADLQRLDRVLARVEAQGGHLANDGPELDAQMPQGIPERNRQAEGRATQREPNASNYAQEEALTAKARGDELSRRLSAWCAESEAARRERGIVDRPTRPTTAQLELARVRGELEHWRSLPEPMLEALHERDDLRAGRAKLRKAARA